VKRSGAHQAPPHPNWQDVHKVTEADTEGVNDRIKSHHIDAAVMAISGRDSRWRG
jgi:hypothetical protein